MKKTLLALSALLVLAACDSGGPHNLTPDQKRRAETHAAAYFDAEHPAGTDASGNLIKRKGSFQTCRPQDSNSNGLVTCTGTVPNIAGGFGTRTMYCGYEANGVDGCSDKDQK